MNNFAAGSGERGGLGGESEDRPDLLHPIDGFFAGTEAQGLAISRNGGETWERLGEDLPEEAINQIILSPLYPQKPMILLALATGLVLSDDDGKTWTAWKSNPAFEAGITCLLAPQGLTEGASLLVGLADGQVLRV